MRPLTGAVLQADRVHTPDSCCPSSPVAARTSAASASSRLSTPSDVTASFGRSSVHGGSSHGGGSELSREESRELAEHAYRANARAGFQLTPLARHAMLELLPCSPSAHKAALRGSRVFVVDNSDDLAELARHEDAEAAGVARFERLLAAMGADAPLTLQPRAAARCAA